MLDSNTIWQMKLIDGNEVFAEVINWDEEADDIQVQNTMSIHKVDGPTGIYYALRPYMTGQKISQIVTIMQSNIQAVTLPSDTMINQYMLTVDSIKNHFNELHGLDLDEDMDEDMDEDKRKEDKVDNIIGINFGSKKPLH